LNKPYLILENKNQEFMTNSFFACTVVNLKAKEFGKTFLGETKLIGQSDP